MTDDCCFGEDYDEIGEDAVLQTDASRDQEIIARLESIADRLAVATMALAGVIADKNKSVLDIEAELRDAQDAIADLQRYGDERERGMEFQAKPMARSVENR
jgi:hypothetical protein